MYFTIAGCNHYYGSDFMEKGMKVKLVKQPDNEYDSEAIQVKIKGLGKVGYVANSPYTMKGESMSAGRLYDKIADKAKGKIVFVTDGGVICKVISDGKDKPVMIEEAELSDKNLSKDENNYDKYIGVDDAEEELKRMEEFRNAQAEVEQKMFKIV